MKSKRPRAFVVDELESRSLLSGFHHGFGGGGPLSNPSPAVQADLTKIQQDQKTLQTDITTLAPTLQTDFRAIITAINNSTTIQAAEQTLTTDLTAFRTTLQADWKAIAAATDSTTRTAAITQLRSDFSTGNTLIQADRQGVQTAIANDPTVQAAKQQLKTDEAPITADQTTLQADFTQLRTDLQAQASSSTGSTTTGSTTGVTPSATQPRHF